MSLQENNNLKVGSNPTGEAGHEHISQYIGLSGREEAL